MIGFSSVLIWYATCTVVVCLRSVLAHPEQLAVLVVELARGDRIAPRLAIQLPPGLPSWNGTGGCGVELEILDLVGIPSLFLH